MQTPDAATPQTIDTVLQVLSWAVIAFGALWAVTGTIGYFHRRAYNLTRAESGASKNIKPDFLTVDKAKRQAAIERGQAYDTVLQAREAPPPAATVEKVALWSQMAATTTAVFAIIAMLVGTLSKISQMQDQITRLSNWEQFTQIVSENKTGTVVAVIVITASVIEMSKKFSKAKPSRKA